MKKVFTHYEESRYQANDLKKAFPGKFKNMDDLDVEAALLEHEIAVFKKKKATTPQGFLYRLGIIPALIVMLFFLALTPFNFLLTGRWGYHVPKLAKWFQSYGLI